MLARMAQHFGACCLGPKHRACPGTQQTVLQVGVRLDVGGPPDVADSSEVLGRSTKNRIQTWACGVPSTELHACFSVRTPVPHALCKVWKSQSPMEQVIPANAVCGPPLFSLRESGGWGLEAELA